MTTDRRSSKSLDPDDAERVRAHLARFVAAEGSQVAVAKKLGVTQQSVSQVMSGASAPGVVLASKLATATGIAFDALLSGRRDAVVRDDGRPVIGSVPGYAEAERLARQIAPRIPESAWQAVRSQSNAGVELVDAEILLGWARSWERAQAKPPLRPDQPGDGLRELPDDGERPPPVTPRGGRR